MLVAELVAAAGVACVRAGGAQRCRCKGFKVTCGLGGGGGGWRVLVVLCGGWLVLVACIEPTDV